MRQTPSGTPIHLAAFLWFMALVAAVLDGAPWELRSRLTVVGVVFEAVGFVLLASDLIVPDLRKLARWAHARRSRQIVVLVDTTVAHSDALLDPRLDQPPFSNVNALEALQWQIDRLKEGVHLVDRESRMRDRDIGRTITANVEETTRTIDNAIAEAQGHFFAWRIVGFGMALVGSILLALANFA